MLTYFIVLKNTKFSKEGIIMTVSNNSMMASQVYANRNVQAQSGVSGYTPAKGTDPTQALGTIAQQLMSTMISNKNGTIDKAEFSQASQALAKNANNSSSSIDNAFSKMGTNGDGQINSNEMMSAMKQTHHHHSSSSVANTTSQSGQTSSSTLASSPMTEIQKNLFNKIMSAYGTSTPATGTTTTSLSA